ncbi:MAG: DegT/DnrJ/EryC1/StrS family aminotransferase [Mariniphaga sp.]
MAGTELFGNEERKEVLDVLETGILFRYGHDSQRNGIWKAKTFEQEFSTYLGAKHTHFCASGTAADSLSLACCGIGYGDEVIVPPYTFIAPIEAVLLAGAIPVFAEIDETLCLSPEGIERAITPRTKAVLLIQVFGSMARMDEILAVCEKHNLILIEDAAPALGGSYKGKMLGNFGKISAFSFDFYKIITAGEGGAIATNDDELYERAHRYSDHGHDHIGNVRGAEQHPILGYNFRGSELGAAVVLAQLRKLPYMIEKQKAHQKVLKDVLQEFPEIRFRNVPDEDGDSATFLSFFLPDPDKAIKVFDEFQKEELSASYWYRNNFHYHRQWGHLKEMKSIFNLPVMKINNAPDYRNIQVPQSDAIMQKLMMTQIMVTWSEEELNTLAGKMRSAIKKALK